jgi:outer membrane protein
LREFNKAKGYQVIYGKKNDNILFADNVYDITGEVIEYLNKLYTSPSSTKE